MNSRIAVTLLLLIAFKCASAAPPVDGFASIEQVVARACEQSQTVVLAKVSGLTVQGGPTTETRTAFIQVARVLKGTARNAPGHVTYSWRFRS